MDEWTQSKPSRAQKEKYLWAGRLSQHQKRRRSQIWSAAPPYSQCSETGASVATTIAAGPIFRLKFANLIQDVSSGASGASSAESNGLVGTIGGFTYEPDFDSGFFDAGIGTLYPQTIKLSCDYTVNHTHGLGWANGTKRTKTFPYNQAGETGTPAGTETGEKPTTSDSTEAKANEAEMEGKKS